MPFLLQPQIYLDASLQHAEVDHHSTVEDPHHPNTVEEDSCIQGSNTTHENNYERLRDAHSNRRTGLLPPLPTGYNREKTVRPNSEGYSGKEPHLPPIAEDRNRHLNLGSDAKIFSNKRRRAANPAKSVTAFAAHRHTDACGHHKDK